MRLPVGVDSWVIECCLEPPGVDDTVSWSLRFIEESRWGPRHQQERVELRAYATPLADWEGATLDTWPVQLAAEGVAFYWEAPHPVEPGPLIAAGHLVISHHGEAPENFPTTTATVVRVRMAGTMYTEDPPDSGSWRQVEPPDVEYTDLERAPKWFPDTPEGPPPCRFLNAVIVDLGITKQEAGAH